MNAFQVVSIPAPAWLASALDDAIAACRFKAAPPVELRPTGHWLGWCLPTGMAPDRRISISGRAHFWRRHELVEVYVHEAAHRLIDHGRHDPTFFCLNHALLLRVDAAGSSRGALASTTGSDLYDISDLPEGLSTDPDGGLGRSLSWAVVTARELAVSELDAEDLAIEVMKRFERWMVDVADEPKRRAQQEQRRSVGDQGQRISQLTEKVWTRNLVIVVLLSLIVSIVVIAQR